MAAEQERARRMQTERGGRAPRGVASTSTNSAAADDDVVTILDSPPRSGNGGNGGGGGAGASTGHAAPVSECAGAALAAGVKCVICMDVIKVGPGRYRSPRHLFALLTITFCFKLSVGSGTKSMVSNPV